MNFSEFFEEFSKKIDDQTDRALFKILESVDEEDTSVSKGIARIFFLPLSSRPENLPPLSSSFKGKFWHTGIIYNERVYEAFGLTKRHSIRNIINPDVQDMLKDAVEVWFTINTRKLLWELNSGTDCATYVARVIGMDLVTKDDEKSPYYPEDILHYIENAHAKAMKEIEEVPVDSKVTMTWSINPNTGVCIIRMTANGRSYSYQTDTFVVGNKGEYLQKQNYHPGKFWNETIKKNPQVYRLVSKS